MDALLRYDAVEICFDGMPVVQNVSCAVCPGEILGIVGESGSGKSTLLKAAFGLLGDGKVTAGRILFREQNILELSPKQHRKICGADIGMIFQDSGASLSPIRTIGAQIYESMAAHLDISREEAREQAMELFANLHLPDGERIWNSYPFQLSGGMNQRVGIAIAMLMRPAVLLADEPTSALDVAVQRQVVQALLQMRDLFGTAIVLVTHDLGVVRAMADHILVLKDGCCVESGETAAILPAPQHPYTRELLAAVPVLRRKL